ncbi:MAG: hypothetical protein ABS58_02320 [Mesorhizobium sp. SCN 65-20]|nr:MAG: hypothetical protein ABS58_02320 [Mesorhizobium sp. SCN 65-20]
MSLERGGESPQILEMQKRKRKGLVPRRRQQRRATSGMVATGNERLAAQLRRILGTHYMNRFQCRRQGGKYG